MATKIAKKIVGFALVDKEAEAKKAADAAIASAAANPDVDPLKVVIERRPEGELESTSSKIEYYTHEGKQKLYIIISYMPVEGVINGQKVTIERPIEFFLPTGQFNEDSQWMSATMRNLSLCARGGFLSRALQDARSVKWANGMVSCGTTVYDNKVKTMRHESEVAAIAWSIQQMLMRRGFLDADGNQVPVEVLAKRYQKRIDAAHGIVHEEEVVISNDSASSDSLEHSGNVKEFKPLGSKCPKCSQMTLTRQGGCDTCLECGHSKCS